MTGPRYTDEEVLAMIDAAFGPVPRPEHFTDHPGCCECAEHDALLQQRDRETLSIADVGSQAWNPITMCTPPAFAYWMPVLARLAMQPPPLPDFDWFGDTIIRQLRWNGPRNERWAACTRDQRRAVAAFLEHLFDTRTDEIELYDCHHELLEALATWSE